MVSVLEDDWDVVVGFAGVGRWLYWVIGRRIGVHVTTKMPGLSDVMARALLPLVNGSIASRCLATYHARLNVAQRMAVASGAKWNCLFGSTPR